MSHLVSNYVSIYYPLPVVPRCSCLPIGVCQSPAAKVFESFGEIRCVDIPVLDPYRRNNMKEAKTFSTFDAHLTFEAYIQYVEYISFVKVCDGYMTVDVWSEHCMEVALGLLFVCVCVCLSVSVCVCVCVFVRESK